MTISVILPTYNGERFIGRTIDAVLTQTYDELELIIVNDGSTDNTKVICEQYQRSNVSKKKIILINKENGGVLEARNIGLKAVNGKYIAFIDHDDYILPSMYEN